MLSMGKCLKGWDGSALARLVVVTGGLLGLLGCDSQVGAALQEGQQGATTRDAVVYGDDDRVDYYEASEQWQDIVQSSVVALVPWKSLTTTSEGVEISAETLKEFLELCPDERFVEQRTPANCSGSLIGDDLVLTAGHCISSDSCSETAFVFDFFMESEGQPAHIGPEDVVGCKEVLISKASSADFAIVRLERSVGDLRTPVPVRREDLPLDKNQSVTMIGFPSGLPTKVAGGGRVVAPRTDSLDYFEASVDAFGGNSGSALFDDDGQVVGILVRGKTDYVYDEEAECTRVNVLNEPEVGGTAEDATYVARAIAGVCGAGAVGQALCGPIGNMCETAQVVAPVSQRIRDSFLGFERKASGQCGGAEGPDRAYRFALDEPTHFRADARSARGKDMDMVLYLRKDCDESARDLACDNDSGRRVEPRIDSYLAAGKYILFLDNLKPLASEWRSGFRLDLAFSPINLRNERKGNVCEVAENLVGEKNTVEGRLEKYENNSIGRCGGGGPERVYSFDVEKPSTVRANVTGLNAVLYIRKGCSLDAVELACNGDNIDEAGPVLETALLPGTYFLYLDSKDGVSGHDEFELEFSVEPLRGATCADAEEIEAESQFLTGSMAAYSSNSRGECGGAGADRVFTFTVDERQRFSAESDGFDTVMYLRSGCDDDAAELACNDDTGGSLGSKLDVVLEPGQYFLFLDSYGSISVGATFDLSLRFQQAPPAVVDAD